MDDSFLLYGIRDDGFVEYQLIYLIVEQDNLNDVDIWFMVDWVVLLLLVDYICVIFMFDDCDQEVVVEVCFYWKEVKVDGFQIVYWQQI